MKNLADIKRAMTVGSKWHTVHHGYAPNDGKSMDFGVRRIVEANTVSVLLVKPDNSASNFYFPKASNIRIDSEDSFSVRWDDDYVTNNDFYFMTYTRVSG